MRLIQCTDSVLSVASHVQNEVSHPRQARDEFWYFRSYPSSPPLHKYFSYRKLSDYVQGKYITLCMNVFWP